MPPPNAMWRTRDEMFNDTRRWLFVFAYVQTGRIVAQLAFHGYTTTG
jgi:hypothetical protein